MILKVILIFLFTISGIIQITVAQEIQDKICIPGERVGIINKTSSERTLIDNYGKENVIRKQVYIGEGFSINGTLLFANTKDELQILWSDTINYSNPYRIMINHDSSKWETQNGIRIGTSLKEIEKLNGKAFTMLGFGWDYSGTIVSWNQGNLENSGFNYKFFVIRLKYSDNKNILLTEKERSEITGDKELISSNKILQFLEPKVYQIIIDL
jgi:hypothetical protein